MNDLCTAKDRQVLRALVSASKKGLSLDTAFAKACIELGLTRTHMDECKSRLYEAGKIGVRVNSPGVTNSFVVSIDKVLVDNRS